MNLTIKSNKEIIKSIITSMDFLAKKQDNYNIDGVHMNLINNSLEIVATDSYRIYYNKIEIENNDNTDFFIPSFFIRDNKEFIKNLTQIKIKDGYIIFINDNNECIKTFLSRVSFPDYNSLFKLYNNLDNDNYIKVEIRKEYIQQLKKYIKDNKLEKYDKYCINFKEYYIFSNNEGIKIPIHNLKFENYDHFNVRYNINYFTKLLKINKNIYIPINNSTSPCIIKNNNEIALLMPISLADFN